jgi:ferritin-like metal-binding protein YciE
MIAFARLNPDSTGKLVAHAFSYEHMEFATYELLRRFAERVGDAQVAEAARTIGAQEAGMAERLQGAWSRAVEASLMEKRRAAASSEVTAYLRDARALEAQSLQFLRLAGGVAKTPELREILREHESQTREHQRLLERRLADLGSGPSRIHDAALRAGAVGIVGFFAAQPDTAVKLAGFAHALEAVEQAGYGLLATLADRAEDAPTADLAERIMQEERMAGERIAGSWDAVVEAQMNGG